MANVAPDRKVVKHSRISWTWTNLRELQLLWSSNPSKRWYDQNRGPHWVFKHREERGHEWGVGSQWQQPSMVGLLRPTLSMSSQALHQHSILVANEPLHSRQSLDVNYFLTCSNEEKNTSCYFNFQSCLGMNVQFIGTYGRSRVHVQVGKIIHWLPTSFMVVSSKVISLYTGTYLISSPVSSGRTMLRLLYIDNDIWRWMNGWMDWQRDRDT